MPIEGGTGAAGANNIKAGGAYYEVVGRDGVSPVLTKIEARVKGFRGFMQRTFTAGFASGGGVLGAGAAGFAIGAVRLWEDLKGGIIAYNRELEKAAELAGELAKAQERIRGQEQERIDLIADPGEKADALRERIAQIQTELKGTSTAAKAARADLDNLGRILSVGNTVDKLLGSHEGFTNDAQARLDTAKSAGASLREELVKDMKAFQELMNPAGNQKLTADIKQAIKDLEFARSTLAISPEQKEFEQQIREFQKRGAAPGDIEKIRQEQRIFDDSRKRVDFSKEQNDLRERLQKDFQFRDMDPNERAVAEMQQKAQREGLGFNIEPFQEMIDKLRQTTREVKVSTRADIRTLGFGDNVQKQMLTIQQQIEKNTQPDKVGKAFAAELKVR